MIPTNSHRQATQEEDSVVETYAQLLRGAKTGGDGLTYKESTYPAAAAASLRARVREVPWDLAVDDDRGPDGCGAHSLLHLARKSINRNLDRLGIDALRATPLDPWGKWIWQDAVATYVAPTTRLVLWMATEGSRHICRRKDTLELWQRFVTAYQSPPPSSSPSSQSAVRLVFGDRRYPVPLSQSSPLPGRLVPVMARVNSPSFVWLVKLRMKLLPPSHGDSDAELRALPQLVNLVSLFISACTDSGSSRTGVVTDGLVRSWCRAAVHNPSGPSSSSNETCCFSRLHTLSLHGFAGVTANVFEYASWLPELRWLDLSLCHPSTAITTTAATTTATTTTAVTTTVPAKSTASSPWKKVPSDTWKAMRREWKQLRKQEKGREHSLVISVTMPGIPATKRCYEPVATFVRSGSGGGVASKRKRPAQEPDKGTSGIGKGTRPVMRKKRIKDLKDVLAEFRMIP